MTDEWEREIRRVLRADHTDWSMIATQLRALEWRRTRDAVIDWLELERSHGTLTPGLADLLTLLHQDREADPK